MLSYGYLSNSHQLWTATYRIIQTNCRSIKINSLYPCYQLCNTDNTPNIGKVQQAAMQCPWKAAAAAAPGCGRLILWRSAAKSKVGDNLAFWQIAARDYLQNPLTCWLVQSNNFFPAQTHAQASRPQNSVNVAVQHLVCFRPQAVLRPSCLHANVSTQTVTMLTC